MEQFPLATLEGGLDGVRRSPKDRGRVELIVRRPAENEREALAEATLDTDDGLVGDSWRRRGSAANGDSPDRRRQLTLMNARAAALVAGDADRWQLAGDQLYVDLDLSCENLPPGTRLAAGSAIIEVTDLPHRGCGKFASRFGVDALKFVKLGRRSRAEPARSEREGGRQRRRAPGRRDPEGSGLSDGSRRPALPFSGTASR
jgi:hypothetical protein